MWGLDEEVGMGCDDGMCEEGGEDGFCDEWVTEDDC